MSSLNIVIEEVSPDVVATVTGSIDLTGLSSQFTTGVVSGIDGSGEIKFANSTLLRYGGMSSGVGNSFGTSTLTPGDTLLVNNEFAFLSLTTSNPLLLVDSAYVSGTAISGTLRFNNKTFLTMGLTNGSYTWSWNGGSNTLNLQVGAAPTPTPTVTSTNTPTVTPTNTGTPASTTTPTPTPTNTTTQTPTSSSVGTTQTPTPTSTATPTGTASVTSTPTGTAAVTPTPTGTASVTPTPTKTAAVTPTPTPTASPIYPLTGISVDNQYAYTIGMLGNFSGGSITQGGPADGFAPHPIYTDGDGVPYSQLNAITLGGFNGLNN